MKIELISSAFDILAALLVFILGIFIAKGVGNLLGTTARRSLLIYGWHTIFCFIFARYVVANGGDARGYYMAGERGDAVFSLGTHAVNYLTTIFVQVFQLSFLGTSLVFNIFGVIGLLAFDAALRLVTAEKPRTIRWFATLIVFLPSISFWSSAIGKDSLAFMATGLALWAALNLRHRIPVLLIAVAVMLMVRPHMAGIMIMALALSFIFQRKVPLRQRLLLGTFALAAAAIMVPFGLQYAGVGDENTEDLSSYIEERQQQNQAGGTSIDLASMSPPMQLYTYLFRPLPIEASGIFGLAASMDNMILLFLFIAGGWRLLKGRKQVLIGNRSFLWFYSLVAWTVLALTTANLGISMRQKWMVAPILIFLLISVLGKRRGARRISRTQPVLIQHVVERGSTQLPSSHG
ncbi:MAG TPA: hypothetical protein VIP51_04220 [Eoetvoesiella sp.]